MCWPGLVEHDPGDQGFTPRTYVHPMDEGLGDAAFLDRDVRSQDAGEGERPTRVL